MLDIAAPIKNGFRCVAITILALAIIIVCITRPIAGARISDGDGAFIWTIAVDFAYIKMFVQLGNLSGT